LFVLYLGPPVYFLNGLVSFSRLQAPYSFPFRTGPKGGHGYAGVHLSSIRKGKKRAHRLRGPPDQPNTYCFSPNPLQGFGRKTSVLRRSDVPRAYGF